jgi:hypothetical protein
VSIESAGKPAAAMSARNGPWRLFQLGTLKFLSLPTQVSTMMRWPCDSISRAWMLITTWPSAVAKCGRHHGTFARFSAVRSGRIQVAFPATSTSMIFVIVTSPIFQFIPNSARLRLAARGLRRCAALGRLLERRPARPHGLGGSLDPRVVGV